MNYILIGAAAFIFVAVILVILKIRNDGKKVQNSQKYLQAFRSLYADKNVLESLTIIRDDFKKGSVEYIAIDKAMFYLTQSIARDYKTAFLILEKVFSTIEVKEFHSEVIEREKQNVMLLLN